ncbi:unnamed protein product [Adineta steineri]|uniref:LEM domain-containing protein n=1 Tax=Adineta steineri TaxID=433720 RepID=A0A814Z0D6_9BILA|nr:unnamed protein product [Adineta steineri]CAF3498314.1 unnamed protein product [Adineta steineri]
MPLTDQQLRQELVQFGETVPPITQRNREQLRTRLQVLQARPRPRSPARASPTRARVNTSPPRATTRSRPVRGLIELSDSETDLSANDYLPSRSGAKIQTRSIAVGRDTQPSTNVTADVEESIARHRREIQQLIDSARDRTRATSANLSATKYEPSSITPLRPTSTSSRHRTPLKSDITKLKQPSWFNNIGKEIKSFWKTYKDTIIQAIKLLFFGLLLGGGLILLKKKAGVIIPHRQGITCSPENATYCDDMQPIIHSVKQFLEARTGEVDCGFRDKSYRYVTKPELNKYLDEKKFKFEAGPEQRWNTLVSYIVDKPVDDISLLDVHNGYTTDLNHVIKMSAQKGTHSLMCRARKGINSAMQNLAWLLLGTTGFLTLGWLIKRRSKQHQDAENTYKDFIEKITDLLENQYEEHIRDSETKPWLAISHIRDMLIPPQDRKRLKTLWERAKKQISESESRVRSESQLIHGEEFDVWRWIQPRAPSSPSSPRKKRAESPHSSNEESYVYMPADVGLTECLKLRNFFDPDTNIDDDEMDLVVDSIQNRCATVRRIEHIGIHSIFVYLKFSSKEAASQGFHLLNNWKFHGREIIAKYLRLQRYHEHFPEAINSSSTN